MQITVRKVENGYILDAYEHAKPTLYYVVDEVDVPDALGACIVSIFKDAEEQACKK